MAPRRRTRVSRDNGSPVRTRNAVKAAEAAGATGATEATGGAEAAETTGATEATGGAEAAGTIGATEATGGAEAAGTTGAAEGTVAVGPREFQERCDPAECQRATERHEVAPPPAARPPLDPGAPGEDVVVEDALLGPTWSKYIVLSRHVADLTMRDKRVVFMLMRNTEGCTSDWFIPRLGITMGEFCVFHTIGSKGK